MTDDTYGYLLVHFVEDHDDGGERIYFSLSDVRDPLRWTRLNGGRPVLTSPLGTTGVRDPFLVRGDGEFFLLATDLKVFGGDDAGWDEWTRRGSRSIVVWRSTDLVDWSQPWLTELAPPEAGMAWAPEATFDPQTGEFLVYWSSALYPADDPERRVHQHSRILVARTRDFRTFADTQVLVDRGPGHGVIDMTAVVTPGQTVRFLKGDDIKLFQQVGGDFFADDFTIVAQGIADELHSAVEAPLVIRDEERQRWYLWVDQFSDWPQGYLALWSDDLASGRWTPVEAGEFHLPPSTKHGGVVPLTTDEWERVAAAYPA